MHGYKNLCDMSMLIKTWRTALSALTLLRAQPRLSKLSDSLLSYKAHSDWPRMLAKCKATADWLVHFLAACLLFSTGNGSEAQQSEQKEQGLNQNNQPLHTYQLKCCIHTGEEDSYTDYKVGLQRRSEW